MTTATDPVVEAEVVVDQATGEIKSLPGTALMASASGIAMSDGVYAGISTLPVSDRQAEILTRELPETDVEIRPDGLVYMGHHKLRQRLNEAFKPGGWALRRLSVWRKVEPTPEQAAKNVDALLTAEFALYAEGRFLAAAMGEQKYQDNGDMTFGDACEGAKSNALTRCCKDLGIALDLWDRSYGERWKGKFALQVWVEGKTRPQWRRVDAPAFYKEKGLTDDSPNRERYVMPAQRAPRRDEPRQEPRPAPVPTQTATQDVRQPVGRGREPGDEDMPAQAPAPRQEAPRAPQGGNGGGNGGRVITDRQAKRLWAIACKDRGMSKDEYRDFLGKYGYTRDTDIAFENYDEIVDAAQNWG